MVHIDSGTAAVLEMGLTPVALLGFALAFGHERGTTRKFLAIAFGIVGLIILFGPGAVSAWTAEDAGAGQRLVGAVAVSTAAIIYGLGSILSRPLLRKYSATSVAGLTTLLGGAMLLVASFAMEPGAGEALRGRWGLAAWSGWLFLVVFGSLVGYSIYMRLLRDLGASRAGMYAFVSPVIAVLLGAAILGEEITLVGVLGMSILLFSAWLAMSGPQAADGREGAIIGQIEEQRPLRQAVSARTSTVGPLRENPAHGASLPLIYELSSSEPRRSFTDTR